MSWLFCGGICPAQTQMWFLVISWQSLNWILAQADFYGKYLTLLITFDIQLKNIERHFQFSIKYGFTVLTIPLVRNDHRWKAKKFSHEIVFEKFNYTKSFRVCNRKFGEAEISLSNKKQLKFRIQVICAGHYTLLNKFEPTSFHLKLLLRKWRKFLFLGDLIQLITIKSSFRVVKKDDKQLF